MTNTRTAIVASPLELIDFVNPNTGRSYVLGETLEQIKARHPTAAIVDADEWFAAKEKALCTEAEEITEDRFMEMLEVLPPQHWQRGNNCESFELMEHSSGRVTTICCRFGQTYFEFQGIAGQSIAAHATHCGQKAQVAS